MAAGSPLQTITRLTSYVANILAAVDIDEVDREGQKVLTHLKRQLADVRLDIRDYEMSDTRAEMVQNGNTAIERLGQIRMAILKASEHNIFGAIDVAHITAEVETVISDIKASL